MLTETASGKMCILDESVTFAHTHTLPSLSAVVVVKVPIKLTAECLFNLLRLHHPVAAAPATVAAKMTVTTAAPSTLPHETPPHPTNL